MEDLKTVIKSILEEVKILEEKIEETAKVATHTTKVITPTATESLREVIKFSEESANNIIQQIDKVEENCKVIDKTVDELLNLNPVSTIKEKLSLIKEKNKDNMNILIKVYELFSFQDLMAQQIKEVINILEETKKNLLKFAATSIEMSSLSEEDKKKAVGKVHEFITGDRINQQDVDKLLEELGL
ncbi:chemotaxis phosphatase, CheZ [Sulfurihydrogenibium azorense Az-Fu1]|jgi:chemotaxis protein CheZ|uniref:Chemotaxis phosphatase, CheZ n=1 Tax=Sulfurihydrogenibium azorense (strain DSM 15241 / OCM 825 / Az-Fu1) TaxID=204536 RepID=C1DW06_SULAA|nr:protein phosphatase CheZ [Sulfurihydrogenibium azorense]ACN98679.1 chemotaxis phosphatase, CheZ [Sulfurihydrogenibium azorense Az-Fu1]